MRLGAWQRAIFNVHHHHHHPVFRGSSIFVNQYSRLPTNTRGECGGAVGAVGARGGDGDVGAGCCVGGSTVYDIGPKGKGNRA